MSRPLSLSLSLSLWLSLAACGAPSSPAVVHPDPSPRVVTATIVVDALAPSDTDGTARIHARAVLTDADRTELASVDLDETGVDAETCSEDGGPPEIGDDVSGDGLPTVAFGCSGVDTYYAIAIRDLGDHVEVQTLLRDEEPGEWTWTGDLAVPAGATVRLAPALATSDP